MDLFFRGSHSTNFVTCGFSKSYNQAAEVPSSKVTCKSPRSPSINCRIMLAFVSMMESDKGCALGCWFVKWACPLSCETEVRMFAAPRETPAERQETDEGQFLRRHFASSESVPVHSKSCEVSTNVHYDVPDGYRMPRSGGRMMRLSLSSSPPGQVGIVVT